MATPNQVAMLDSLFNKAGIRSEPGKLDFCYENGMDIDSLEELGNGEVTIVKNLLEEKANAR